MNHLNDMQRARAMRKVQQYALALIETNLFLDSHPTNRRALDYFEKCRSAYEYALREYEETYGAVTAKNAAGEQWNWVAGAWPWEKEAN
ncbi:MAG: spore coat protein CotJB [Clostridia bacterium]|nr:spore coat protein CotJB [Clostridia bacterium]